jgi:molybdopterin-guanine dinucleotide biosynthesis protein A/molybdopterin converting factor small subunit
MMQPLVDPPASAVVLAGGRSSRMGTSKALLLFDGQPLIVHVVATLRRLFADVVVVSSPGQEVPPMPVTLVRDEVAYQGPVGGLCYGLKAAAEEICFVTACDSAFLSPSLIAHLVGRAAEYDVVVPHWQGRFQPLLAVYRRSVLPLLEEQLTRGELRPVTLFDKVRTLRIDEEEIRRFDGEGSSFFNMNTPADYQEALGRWGAVEAPGHPRQDDSIACKVELFGVARLLARTREVALQLPPGATFSQLFDELAATIPALVGRVITAERNALMDGYACGVNGREFVRTPGASVRAGDTIMILSADAGG